MHVQHKQIVRVIQFPAAALRLKWSPSVVQSAAGSVISPAGLSPRLTHWRDALGRCWYSSKILKYRTSTLDDTVECCDKTAHGLLYLLLLNKGIYTIYNTAKGIVPLEKCNTKTLEMCNRKHWNTTFSMRQAYVHNWINNTLYVKIMYCN